MNNQGTTPPDLIVVPADQQQLCKVVGGQDHLGPGEGKCS
jgi:hypothetical protein